MSFLAFVVIVYLGLCVALFVFQRSMIYYPQPRARGEQSATLPLSVPGAELLISVRAHEGPNAIVYFGGNGEDVTYNLPSFSRAFPQHALYLMNYRGYGGSSGEPTEKALHADALALFDWVHAQHKNIVVIGRSLGSGVAIRLASERPAVRLVLVTPYSSIAELGAQQFPYFPVRWLLQDRYESWRHASKIRVPTLLVAAERDEIIPSESTADLYSRFASGVASLRVIAEVGHNTISSSELYVEALRFGVGSQALGCPEIDGCRDTDGPI